MIRGCAVGRMRIASDSACINVTPPILRFTLLTARTMKITCMYYDISSKDYEACVFNNSQQVIKATEQMLPLYMLYDVEGDEDGTDVCRRFRQVPYLTDVPIIILMDNKGKKTVEEYIQAGATVCVSKPYAAKDIHGTIMFLFVQNERFRQFTVAEAKKFNGIDPLFKKKALLAQVTKIIQEHVANPELSPSFIAEKMNMGLRNLYRRLKEIGENHLTRFILEKRIEYARELLVQTHLSMKEICYESGFSNRGTFYKHFMDTYGYTPREYRERFRSSVKKQREKGTALEQSDAIQNEDTKHSVRMNDNE